MFIDEAGAGKHIEAGAKKVRCACCLLRWPARVGCQPVCGRCWRSMQLKRCRAAGRGPCAPVLCARLASPLHARFSEAHTRSPSPHPCPLQVLITAPAKGSGIPTYVVGVNEADYKHTGGWRGWRTAGWPMHCAGLLCLLTCLEVPVHCARLIPG